MECRKISCLQINAFLNKIFYFCVTGLPSENELSINSTTNWNKSQSNCKDPHSKENNATDMCKVNKDTTEIGMWTNIFRVEISSHVDHGNTFYNNIRIYLFIYSFINPAIITFAMHIYHTNKCLIRLVYE